MAKLTVRNMAQKIAFMCEMQGQISDGHWENSSPHDHYKKWMLRWADVAVGDDVGRTFYAVKDNYDFCNSALLDIVGSRLLLKVKLAKLFPSIIPLLKEDHWVIPDSMEYFQDHLDDLAAAEEWKVVEDLVTRHPDGVSDAVLKVIQERVNGWQAKSARKLLAAGITKETYQAALEWDGYTMADLKKDLKDLKVIVRIQK